ncbi:MAG TPA: pyridoxamine 5'-phosphate oxidase family protein [Steroidobacteraceae bacterium]
MSVTRANVFDFIARQIYGVVASRSADGAPQAALVGFVTNTKLELFFDTFGETRKAENLRRDPRVAFVIGGGVPGDERTVQLEGIADTPVGAELEAYRESYFRTLPDARRRAALPGITYFRVRPHWIRYSDYNANPPAIVVFEGDSLEPSAPTSAYRPTSAY